MRNNVNEAHFELHQILSDFNQNDRTNGTILAPQKSNTARNGTIVNFESLSTLKVYQFVGERISHQRFNADVSCLWVKFTSRLRLTAPQPTTF